MWTEEYMWHCDTLQPPLQGVLFVVVVVFIFLLSFYVLWGRLQGWRMNTKEQGYEWNWGT